MSSGNCDSRTSDTSRAYRYDSADRLVKSGYGYDVFGRTSINGNTGKAYYTNGLVPTETLGTSRNSWSLDAARHLAAQPRVTDGSSTTSGVTVDLNTTDLTGGLTAPSGIDLHLTVARSIRSTCLTSLVIPGNTDSAASR